MRLGLLADIHEAVEPLREALGLFERLGVDEVVHLGDVCRMHRRLDETVELLARANVPGVWGNHDYGLCQEPGEEMRSRFSPRILDYMRTLKPTLVREDCLFTHVEPWLDANDLLQLWYFDGPPETPDALARCFDAVGQRVLFSGHVHTWFLAGQAGRIPWDGKTAVRLAPPGRYVVILHALVEGYCSVYDTATGDLVPYTLSCRDTK
jgi:predicted phosphodiesterase